MARHLFHLLLLSLLVAGSTSLEWRKGKNSKKNSKLNSIQQADQQRAPGPCDTSAMSLQQHRRSRKKKKIQQAEQLEEEASTIGLPEGTQISDSQATQILTYLKQSSAANGKANTNFLVFGTGHDTPWWRQQLQSLGQITFIEDNPEWLTDADKDVTVVKYSTQQQMLEAASNDQLKQMAASQPLAVPPQITGKKYDVILVDAPRGWPSDSNDGPAGPGRLQSLALATKLIKPGGTIVVDDWQRPMERRMADVLLGAPAVKIERPMVPGCCVANTQAYFPNQPGASD